MRHLTCRGKDKKLLSSIIVDPGSRADQNCVLFSYQRWYQITSYIEYTWYIESKSYPYLVFCAGQLALRSSVGSIQWSRGLGSLLKSSASRRGKWSDFKRNLAFLIHTAPTTVTYLVL